MFECTPTIIDKKNIIYLKSKVRKKIKYIFYINRGVEKKIHV